jgi:hypothetical protein
MTEGHGRVTVLCGDSCMRQRQFYECEKTFRGGRMNVVHVVCPGWPSTATRIGVKERMDQHIRDNRKSELIKLRLKLASVMEKGWF